MQLLKVITGSHAYGLALPTSDVDYRGVYVADKGAILAPFSPPKVIEGEGDDVSYELRHFFKLASNANPNVIELLFVPERCHHFITPLGQKLLDNKHLFLSKQIVRTYIGFSDSCVKRMNSGHTQTGDRKEIREHGFDTKYAAHAMRVLFSGAMSITNKTLHVDVSNHRERFLQIRRGEVPKEECLRIIRELRDALSDLEEGCLLPDKPDLTVLTRLCVELTEGAWAFEMRK